MAVCSKAFVSLLIFLFSVGSADASCRKIINHLRTKSQRALEKELKPKLAGVWQRVGEIEGETHGGQYNLFALPEIMKIGVQGREVGDGRYSLLVDFKKINGGWVVYHGFYSINLGYRAIPQQPWADPVTRTDPLFNSRSYVQMERDLYDGTVLTKMRFLAGGPSAPWDHFVPARFWDRYDLHHKEVLKITPSEDTLLFEFTSYGKNRGISADEPLYGRVLYRRVK